MADNTPKFLDPKQRALRKAKFTRLQDETAEVTLAVEKFKDTQTRITSDVLAITKADAEYTERSSKFQARMLDESISLRNELADKSVNPFDRIIEPMKRVFSPETSMAGTAAALRGKQRSIALQKQQDDVKTRESQSKLLILEAEDKQSRALLVGEQSDVTAIATEIAAEQQQMTAAEKHRSNILLFGSTTEMQTAVDNKIISQRQMDESVQIQKNKKVVAATAAVRLESDKHKQMLNELTQMDDADLDNAVAEGFPAIGVEIVKRNRQAQRRSEHELQAQATIRKTTDDELRAEAASGTNPELTSARAGRAIKARTAKDVELDQKITTANAISLDKTKVEENFYLETLSSQNEVEKLLTALKKHEESGEGVFMWQSRDGAEMPLQFIDASQVQARLTSMKNVSLQSGRTQAVIVNTEQTINRDARQLALLVGLSVTADTTSDTILQAVLAGKGQHNLPPEANTSVALALTNLQFTLSSEFINDPQSQMESRIKGAEGLSQAVVKARDAAIIGLKPEVQRAMLNYYNDGGTFRNQDDAIINVTNKLDLIVGIPAYDNVTKVITDFIGNLDDGKHKTEKEKLEAIQAQFQSTVLTEAEKSAMALREGTPKDQNSLEMQMAALIYFQPVLNTYVTAFEQLGLPQVAQQILNGLMGRTKTGAFQERVLFEQMKKAAPNVTFEDLSTLIRQLSSTAYTDYYGDQAALHPDMVEGYNAILFENKPNLWTERNIIGRMEDGILTIRRDTASAQRTIDTARLF